MDKRKTIFFSYLLVTITVMILLGSGSDVLTRRTPGSLSIPLGTFITWIGMIAFPLGIYWGIKELRTPTRKVNRILSNILKVILILGILWAPLSYLLAGNLSFTFTEKETFQGGYRAMQLFWGMSYGIGIAVLLTLLTYWIASLFKK